MYLTILFIIKYNIIIYNENDVIVLSMLSHFDSCKKGAKCRQYYIRTQKIFSCEDPFVNQRTMMIWEKASSSDGRYLVYNSVLSL